MKKRRYARAGEQKMWDFDVLAYSKNGGRFDETRVIIRGRLSGYIVEEASVIPIWALMRAVMRLDKLNRSVPLPMVPLIVKGPLHTFGGTP